MREYCWGEIEINFGSAITTTPSSHLKFRHICCNEGNRFAVCFKTLGWWLCESKVVPYFIYFTTKIDAQKKGSLCTSDSPNNDMQMMQYVLYLLCCHHAGSLIIYWGTTYRIWQEHSGDRVGGVSYETFQIKGYKITYSCKIKGAPG